MSGRAPLLAAKMHISLRLTCQHTLHLDRRRHRCLVSSRIPGSRGSRASRPALRSSPGRWDTRRSQRARRAPRGLAWRRAADLRLLRKAEVARPAPCGLAGPPQRWLCARPPPRTLGVGAARRPRPPDSLLAALRAALLAALRAAPTTPLCASSGTASPGILARGNRRRGNSTTGKTRGRALGQSECCRTACAHAVGSERGRSLYARCIRRSLQPPHSGAAPR